MNRRKFFASLFGVAILPAVTPAPLSGFIKGLRLADTNLKATFGTFDASLGHRSAAVRPCLTINRIPHFLNQLIAEQREGIKVSSSDEMITCV